MISQTGYDNSRIRLNLLFFSFAAVLFTITSKAQTVITGFSPSSGAIGTNVIISGTGFSTAPANNIVYFGSAKANVSAASAVSLTVVVPAGFSSRQIAVITNGSTAYSAVPFIVTFAGGGPFNPGSFKPFVDLTTANPPAGITFGDLNGDGKPEMIVTNRIGSISVYKNACTATSIDFSANTDFVAGDAPYSVEAGDVDGDGLLDVIVGDANLYTVSIYRNTSSGGIISLAPKVDLTTAASVYDVKLGEIDGDGKPDIVAVNSGNVMVFRNTSVPGNISFAAGLTFQGGTYNEGIVICDINGNGKADILTCYNGACVLNNTSTPGNISFDTRVFFGQGNSCTSIAVGNLDTDNKPDIALANYSGNKILVLKNTGAGNSISFDNPVMLTASFEPWSVVITDMNGDGKQDLVANDLVTDSVCVFMNNSVSNLLFDTERSYAIAGTSIHCAVADFNNDGRPDIAAAIQNLSYNISLLCNKVGEPPTITSFTPTSAGQGFAVTINGTNLGAVNAVSFGGVNATSFTVVSDSKITATVSTGASGSVSVTTPAGVASLAGFTYAAPVSISAVTPLFGPADQSVKISGSGFNPVASENIVYFGGAKSIVNSVSPSALYVTVPSNAMYAPITVTANGLAASWQQPFNVTFPGGTINATSFIKKIERDEGNSIRLESMTLGDIDGDGRIDIVGAGYQDSLAVYRNTSVNGSVSFSNRIGFHNPTHPENVELCDFDGDGKLDALVINEGIGSLSVFHNVSTPGYISFEPMQYINYSGALLKTGDVDGDGKPDIVIMGNGGVLTILRNTSSINNISFIYGGGFTGTTGIGFVYAEFMGDVDGDGKPDVIAASNADTIFSIFRNTSTIGSVQFTRYDVGAGHQSAFVTMADIDGDGKRDIILSEIADYGSALYDTTIVVLKNRSTAGNFSFSRFDIHASHQNNFSISDMDGDGKPDIIVAKHSNAANLDSISVLKNTSEQGLITFNNQVSYFVGSSAPYPGSVNCGDFDGDGKPDIALLEFNRDAFAVYINQSPSEVTLCPNGDVGLISNLNGASYQWQVDTGSGYMNVSDNTNYSGSHTMFLNLQNIPSSWYGYKYRCLVNASYSKIFSLKFENKWTGAVNSSWEVPGNWSCNEIPDLNTDVIINSGTVVIHADATIRTMSLGPDAIFTVNPGIVLTITH